MKYGKYLGYKKCSHTVGWKVGTMGRWDDVYDGDLICLVSEKKSGSKSRSIILIIG